MATIFGLPEGFKVPEWEESLTDGHYDMKKDNAVCGAFVERLQQWCVTNGSGAKDLLGEIVRFPVGDGAAEYMVYKTKPLSLIHLPLHDSWQIPEAHARGLRVADIRGQVQADKRMAKLLGEGAVET